MKHLTLHLNNKIYDTRLRLNITFIKKEREQNNYTLQCFNKAAQNW